MVEDTNLMLDPKLVIIKVDGGIVSQLYFFAAGKLFEKKRI